MASTKLPITADQAVEAMLDGLTSRIRAALREIIMERLAPDVDAAVEAGVASLKMAIEAHTDQYHMNNVVNILIIKKPMADGK